jgi:NO-binding membrane sensor protein with MHYT domain
MLPVSYDPLLVAASVLVAIMAAFTGLRLSSGLAEMGADARKVRIAKAAVALGGGIWSMHFVAMMAVRLPVPIEYDALLTLGSALVAILITGIGLIILHFGERTLHKILVAGVLMGLGIVSMHYVGMSAVSGNCVVSYQPAGYVISTATAIVSSTCALWIAYKRRSIAHLAISAVVLGIAISAMHYSAMIFTRFSPAVKVVAIADPVLSSGMLALLVALATFVICGIFLLTAIPIDRSPAGRAMAEGTGAGDDGVPAAMQLQRGPCNLPYQKQNMTRFIAASDVFAVKAEGHYTRIYGDEGDYFCPWPISRVETHLDERTFLRTHRSYLVNVNHIKGFQRSGDKAYCIVSDEHHWEVPVSRTKINDVMSALGLA